MDLRGLIWVPISETSAAFMIAYTVFSPSGSNSKLDSESLCIAHS